GGGVFWRVLGGAPPLGGVVGFSPDVEHRETPAGGWATWSHGYTGDVYMTGIEVTDLTLTLPAGTAAFYFYAEPDPFAIFEITATSGGVSQSWLVDGSAGASIFGVYTDDGSAISSIDVSSRVDFAVGEFGIATVPEPSTLLLMGAGLLATRMRRRKAEFPKDRTRHRGPPRGA